MARTGRWTAVLVVLCIALQNFRTVRTVSVCLLPTGAKYVRQPYLSGTPIEDAQLPGYAYSIKTPELPEYPYPECGTIHKTAVPAINEIPRYVCECSRPDHRFCTPISNAVEDLYVSPQFFQGESTEGKRLLSLGTNRCPWRGGEIPMLPYNLEYINTRHPKSDEFLTYPGHISRTLDRRQRHITLVSPPENHCNVSRNLWTSVIIVKKTIYRSPPKDAFKKSNKNKKISYRRKRSIGHFESSLTLGNRSKFKREASEPMHVPLMGAQCDGCLVRSDSTDFLQHGNGPHTPQSILNNAREARFTQGNKALGNDNTFNENSDCTSSYCKKSIENPLIEKDLNTKVQKYLDKLKKDFETFKSTIEKKTAEAKEKLRSQNSVSKLDEKLRNNIKQGSEQPIYGIKINKNNNLLAKSYEAGGWKSTVEDELTDTNKYRETRNLNSKIESFKVNNYGALSDDSISLGQDFMAKLLAKKLVEEPVLMKFVKDYLLRFVNVTAVLERENGGNQGIHENGENVYSMPSGIIQTKRSDGSYLKHSVSDVSQSDSASCGASEHMCAHTTTRHIRQGKNSDRTLQKTKMEGVENGGHVSSFKLSHDDNTHSKKLNAQEEQGTCSCSDSPFNENKYGIKANTEAYPKTSSLGSNIKTGYKTSSLDKQKTNQGLPELSLSSYNNNNRPFDAAKDSDSSLLDDIKELLQQQNCKCPHS